MPVDPGQVNVLGRVSSAPALFTRGSCPQHVLMKALRELCGYGEGGGVTVLLEVAASHFPITVIILGAPNTLALPVSGAHPAAQLSDHLHLERRRPFMAPWGDSTFRISSRGGSAGTHLGMWASGQTRVLTPAR